MMIYKTSCVEKQIYYLSSLELIYVGLLMVLGWKSMDGITSSIQLYKMFQELMEPYATQEKNLPAPLHRTVGLGSLVS